MATLFALSNGDISTIGSLNSAAAIGNPGVIGSVLSASRALAATTSYTNNTPVHGIALCLSSVGAILPTDTITIRLSTTNYVYAASGLSPGRYVNSYVTAAPQAMVGWVLFKLPIPTSYSAAPALSVLGPNTVRLMGLNANPASILVYGPHNARAVEADTLYLTKSLRTDFTTENRTVNGSFSAIANVHICDGVTSSNDFNFNVNAAQQPNSLYLGKGSIFSGVVTMTARNIENFIHVLDGAVLSANYATPTITARIKAISSAIVDLSNVKAWSMQEPNIYNYNSDPLFKWDYLHDITTGYANFNNCTFWAGISCGGNNSNVSNITATNTRFRDKYLFFASTGTATLTSTPTNNFFKIKNIVNNVLFSNLSCDEIMTFKGSFSNLTFKDTMLSKQLNVVNSGFSNSKISNISFSSDSNLELYERTNTITLCNNTSLPDFENIALSGRLVGILKADSCPIKVNGLSCLSSYYYSISANNLTGELNNVLLKDSIYGAGDITFNTSNAPLTINGLTAIRTSVNPVTAATSIGTSVRSLCAPYPGFTSLLLSSVSDNVTTNNALPTILTSNDDFTMELWYNPISAKLANDQSLMGFYSYSQTASCQIGLSITTAGLIKAVKSPSTGGIAAPILTTAIPYELLNNKWQHVALTKASNIYTIYLNGAFAVSASNNTSFANFFKSTNKIFVGARPEGFTNLQSLCGYVAGAKLSYGVKYKDEFTPPTIPFITDAGTIFNLTTAFSAQYSVMPRTFIDIENNKSYYPVTFNKLKFLSNNTLSSSLIDISNSSYEKFAINDSDLSTYGSPLITDSDKDYILGSYVFDKCNFINPVVDANTIQGYQPYTYRESGFAVQYANGDSNNNYRWTRGGKVSLDSSAAFEGRSTEKLESISDDFVLKSNLKLIPVSEGSLVKSIKLTYKTPVTYLSGGSLKIEKNTILGINNDSILSQLTPTNDAWTTVTVSLSDYNNPFWNQKSYIQAYVELTGANNQLHIAKWQTSNI